MLHHHVLSYFVQNFVYGTSVRGLPRNQCYKIRLIQTIKSSIIFSQWMSINTFTSRNLSLVWSGIEFYVLRSTELRGKILFLKEIAYKKVYRS